MLHPPGRVLLGWGWAPVVARTALMALLLAETSSLHGMCRLGLLLRSLCCSPSNPRCAVQLQGFLPRRESAGPALSPLQTTLCSRPCPVLTAGCQPVQRLTAQPVLPWMDCGEIGAAPADGSARHYVHEMSFESIRIVLSANWVLRAQSEPCPNPPWALTSPHSTITSASERLLQGQDAHRAGEGAT